MKITNKSGAFESLKTVIHDIIIEYKVEHAIQR